MSLGWLGFGGDRERPSGASPDKAVAAPRSWVLASVIIASTAALLGTSPEETPFIHYEFSKSLEPVKTELTADAVTARYVITLRADALGPNGVDTTTAARALIAGAVETTGIETDPPFVNFAVNGGELRSLRSFKTSAEVAFDGNCDDPTSGEPCEARLVVELTRLDEGAAGGTVTVEWQVELESQFSIEGEGNDVTDEAPWTAEVAGP